MKVRTLSLVVLLALGLGSAFSDSAEAWRHNNTHYLNRSGEWVRRPHGDWRKDPVPVDATARCNDYTYSHSRHPYAQGTCSYHGGVHDYVGPVSGTSQIPWRPHQHRPGDPEEVPIFSDPREIPLQ